MRHTHHGFDFRPVAHYFDIGGLRLYGRLFAFGHHGSLVQFKVAFFDFNFNVSALLHLHHYGLCTHHRETQRAVVAQAHGEASVLVGLRQQPLGAFVGDVHAHLRLALFF